MENLVSTGQHQLPIQDGTQVSWQQFIQKYQLVLINVASAVVRNRDMAKDVVQESLRKVLLAIRQRGLEFQSPQHARYYIVKTVINSAKDVVKGGSKSVPLDEVRPPAVSGVESVLLQQEQEAEMNRQLEIMRKGLRKLPKELRMVVKLRYKEHLTLAQTSKKLGVPIGTLHYREGIALKKLRNYCEKEYKL